MLKIKKFGLINFCGLICKIFLAVDGYIIQKCLERSYRLVYYQVSGDPAITCCNTEAVRSSRRSDVYLGRCGQCTHAYSLIIAV